MIGNRYGQIRPADTTTTALQACEGMTRVQVVQNVAIDIDQVAPVAALADAVNSPDFVDQRVAHSSLLLLFSWLVRLFRASYALGAWLVNAVALRQKRPNRAQRLIICLARANSSLHSNGSAHETDHAISRID
jgi:hypothetical protein